jgi:transcriptional regulator with XRE-family HTH domain
MVSIDRRIGIRVRGKRLALGLSQDDLAKAIGVCTDTIAAYERATRRVPVEHLTNLANLMGVTMSFFTH